MNCPVSSGFIPGPEPFQPRLPWLHSAAIQIRPVFGSTRYGRVADAVIAVFRIIAHVHGHDHRLPALAAVGAAGNADIDVRRQVAGMPVADVIHRDQGAGIGPRHAWDAIGFRLVITRQSNGVADALRSLRRGLRRHQHLAAGFHAEHRGVDPSVDRGVFFQNRRNPEPMLAGREFVFQGKGDLFRNPVSFRDHRAGIGGGIRLSRDDLERLDVLHPGGSAEAEFDAFERCRALAALDGDAEAEDRIEILADERGAHRLRGFHGRGLRRTRTMDQHVVQQNAGVRRSGHAETDFARAFRQGQPDLGVEIRRLSLPCRLGGFPAKLRHPWHRCGIGMDRGFVQRSAWSASTDPFSDAVGSSSTAERSPSPASRSDCFPLLPRPAWIRALPSSADQRPTAVSRRVKGPTGTDSNDSADALAAPRSRSNGMLGNFIRENHGSNPSERRSAYYWLGNGTSKVFTECLLKRRPLRRSRRFRSPAREGVTASKAHPRSLPVGLLHRHPIKHSLKPSEFQLDAIQRFHLLPVKIRELPGMVGVLEIDPFKVEQPRWFSEKIPINQSECQPRNVFQKGSK